MDITLVIGLLVIVIALFVLMTFFDFEKGGKKSKK